MNSALFSLFIFLVCSFFGAHLEATLLTELSKKGLNIDLQDPVYENGVVFTTKGGVIKGDGIFIQARKIRYTRKKGVHQIEATGDLFFQYGNQAYTAESVRFDLDKRTAVIESGYTYNAPWFTGGKRFIVHQDGSTDIEGGIVTTSEGLNNEWSMESKEAVISKDRELRATSVGFWMGKVPFFWLPVIVKDLNSEKSPFKYRLRWKGRANGLRLGISYMWRLTDEVSGEFLFDVSTRRGAGGGAEINYKSPTDKTTLSLFNYYGHDLAGDEDGRKKRYRFQGRFKDSLFNDNINVLATYDKRSDPYFLKNYGQRGMKSGHVAKTEITFFRDTENWKASLNTRLRINKFQTIKRELPLFRYLHRPYSLQESGIVLQTKLSAGFLDYQYDKNARHVHDFHSSRVDIGQKIFRKYVLFGSSITPYVGYRFINYNNNKKGHSATVAFTEAGAEVYTRLERTISSGMQAIEPYVRYDYISRPTSSIRQHYIFNIEDAWAELNLLRFGVRHFFLGENVQDFRRRLAVDLYSQALFSRRRGTNTVSRMYTDLELFATERTTYAGRAIWNAQHNQMDYYSLLSKITLSERVAFSLEYRHHGKYDWRKVDRENFILESVKREKNLLHSPLSHKRDVIIAHLFFRFTPYTSLEIQSKHGWHQDPGKGKYHEYEFGLETLIRGIFRVSLTTKFRPYKRPRDRYEFSLRIALAPKTYSGFTGVRGFGDVNYDY